MPPGCADDAVGLEDVVEPWVKGLLAKLATMAAPVIAAIAPVNKSTEASASSAGGVSVAPAPATKDGSVTVAGAGSVEIANTEIATTTKMAAPANAAITPVSSSTQDGSLATTGAASAQTTNTETTTTTAPSLAKPAVPMKVTVRHARCNVPRILIIASTLFSQSFSLNLTITFALKILVGYGSQKGCAQSIAEVRDSRAVTHALNHLPACVLSGPLTLIMTHFATITSLTGS